MDQLIDVPPEGVITNLKTGRVIPQRKNSRGDMQVSIGRTTKMVKELVAERYLGFVKNGKKELVYHRDGDRANCRAENLIIDRNRCVGRYGGKGMFDTSEHRGVSWDQRMEKWRGKVEHRGRRYELGMFETEEMARKAVERKRSKLKIENI